MIKYTLLELKRSIKCLRNRTRQCDSMMQEFDSLVKMKKDKLLKCKRNLSVLTEEAVEYQRFNENIYDCEIEKIQSLPTCFKLTCKIFKKWRPMVRLLNKQIEEYQYQFIIIKRLYDFYQTNKDSKTFNFRFAKDGILLMSCYTNIDINFSQPMSKFGKEIPINIFVFDGKSAIHMDIHSTNYTYITAYVNYTNSYVQIWDTVSNSLRNNVGSFALSLVERTVKEINTLLVKSDSPLSKISNIKGELKPIDEMISRKGLKSYYQKNGYVTTDTSLVKVVSF